MKEINHKHLISAIMGAGAYGLSLRYLNSKTLLYISAYINNETNATAMANNLHPSVCDAPNWNKNLSLILSLIGFLPTAGFAMINLYQVMDKGVSKKRLFCICLVGIISGMQNTSIVIDSVKALFFDCQKTLRGSQKIVLYPTCTVAILTLAIANVNSIGSYLTRHRNEIKSLLSCLGILKNKERNELNLTYAKINLRFHRQHMIMSMRDYLDNNLEILTKLDVSTLLIDKLFLVICGAYCMMFACKSVEELASKLFLSLMPQESELSKVVGMTSWVVVSLNSACLINDMLIKPAMPRVFDNQAGIIPLVVIITLSLISAFPYFAVPFLQQDISLSRKVLDATALFINCFVFASFALLSKVEQHACRLMGRDYISREQVEAEIIDKLKLKIDSSKFEDTEEPDNIEDLTSTSNLLEHTF